MNITLKLLILTLAIFTLLMSGCQLKDEVPEGEVLEEPLQVIQEVINYGEFEYDSIVAECEIDNDSSRIICLDEDNSDYKNVDSFLNEFGEDGWELVDIMKGSEGKFVFVMKRAN